MKEYKKVGVSVFLLFSLFFAFIPNVKASPSDYWVMKKNKMNDILNETQKKIVGDTLITMYNDNPPEKCAIASLVKNGIVVNLIKYYFKDLPISISKKAAVVIFRIGISVYSGGITKGIDSFEKLTVQEANKFLLNFLMSNQMKVASGEFKTSYIGLINKKLNKARFSYVILSKPINGKEEEVIVEIYSNKYIESPMSKGSFGDLGSIVWREEDFISSGKTKIPPFIVRAKGILVKEYGGYFFKNNREDLNVEVDLDHPVPEIEDSDFIIKKGDSGIKIDFIFSKIVKPALNNVKSTSQRVGRFFSSKAKAVGDGIGKAFRKAKEMLGLTSGAKIIILRGKDSVYPNEQQRANEEKGGKLSGAKDNSNNNSLIGKESGEKKDKLADKKTNNNQLKIAVNNRTNKKNETTEVSNSMEKKGKNNLEKEAKNELNSQEIKGGKKISREEKESRKTANNSRKTKKQQKETVSFCNVVPNQKAVGNKIIFNEIAWMGTTNSANDEWMELKNISNQKIDLNGWQIISGKGKIKIPLSGNIAPGGFFLLERTDDSSVPNKKADKIYTGGLNNSGGTLYLFDKKCQLEDAVLASAKWPAGISQTRRTMERKKDLSWQTSSNINGTPKEENSIGRIIYYGGAVSLNNQGQSQTEGNNNNGEQQESTTTEEINNSGENGNGNENDTTTTDATTTENGDNEENEQDEQATTTNNGLPPIVISEIQIKGGEFVELYNQSGAPTSTKGWYLSYFSSKKDWNNPYRINIPFPETTLLPEKYFLIALKDYSASDGYPAADWSPSPSSNLSNSNGSLGVFRNNPATATTSQEAEGYKIDLVSWGKTDNVKEAEEANRPADGESLQRKKENGNYVDTNNNKDDFLSSSPNPTNSNGDFADIYPPTAPENFRINSIRNNAVSLSWATSTDIDTPTENISYVVYFTDKDGKQSTSTATTTSLTINNLYYDSDYQFSIRAFDGFRYSTSSAVVSAHINSENPLWANYGKNVQRDFLSPFSGEITTSTSFSFDLSDYGQAWTGVAVDQNGTVYLGVSSGLLAIEANNGTTSEKWFLQTGGRLYQEPVIGNDGTVYILSQEKIMAVSPNGELRWQKEVKTTYSLGSGMSDLDVFLLGNSLYYIYQDINSSSVNLIAINKENGNTEWKKKITADPFLTSPSHIVSYNGEIIFSLGDKIYSFDENGNVLWMKTIPVDNHCASLYSNNARSLTVKGNNMIFIGLGTHLDNYNNCSDTLFNLDLQKAENSTSSTTTIITPDDLKWKADIKKAETGKNRHLLISGNNVLVAGVIYNIMGPNNHCMEFVNLNNGSVSTSTIESTYPKISKNNNGVIAVYGSNNQEIINYSLTFDEIWRYNLIGHSHYGSIIFPMALTDNYLIIPTDKEVLFFYNLQLW